MARKDNTFSVLQFDERLIALLRVRRSDKGIEVVEAHQTYGEWPADADLQKALREFAKEHRLADEPVYTVLPRHDMTARILNLPSHELGEITNMIRLSAEDYVPFPLDDLVIDQCILERQSDGSARILAVFAHKDVIERHVRLLREAGVEPERIYLSTTCLASAAVAARRGSDERYALVDLSSGGVEVLVMNGAQLEYGRGVASPRSGPLRDTPIEDLVEELSLEVRASLSAHRREAEDGEGAEKVYLCSEWADLPALAEPLSAQTGYDCQPASFVQRLVTHGGEKLTVFPVAALGAALAVQDRASHAIDLVPASLAASRAAASRKRRLILGAAVLGVVLLAAGAYWAQAACLRWSYMAELSARAEKLRPAAEGVIEKTRQLRILQRQVDPSGSALEVLAQVSESAPPSGINIIQFTYERGVRIDIAGRASTTNEIDKFAQSLLIKRRTSIVVR